MKGWFITALAVLGGYVALKWFTGQAGGSAGSGAHNPPGAGTGQTSPVAAATGVGDFWVAPVTSGVTGFNTAAIANGHGDQVAAAYHQNTLSIVNGSHIYEPAFGPNTNTDPNNVVLI